MPHLFKFPSESGGFDRDRNLFVMPLRTTDTFYLVAGPDLTVESTDKTIVDVSSQSADDKTAHGKSGLSGWENSQTLRRLSVNSGAQAGHASITAKDVNGRDQIKPLDVFVVNETNARRVGDAGAIEPTLRSELEALTLRQAVLRIADDQLYSRVKTNTQGISLYHLNSAYGTLWCGAFAYWCWQQAALVKKVANPFGDSSEPLLSPQKVINFGMRGDGKSQLLQYAGPNPMTMKGPPQPLQETGTSGYNLEPGDIACWRAAHAMDFKHVSFVVEVNGKSFTDMNGNAYDAGSGSALARISHDDMSKKLPDGSYKVFFLHVSV